MSKLDLIIGSIGITLLLILVYLQKVLRKRYNQRMGKQRGHLNKVPAERAGKLRATEYDWGNK